MFRILMLTSFVLSSLSSFAAENPGSGYNALDFRSCSFINGKDMEDLRKLDTEYVDWASKNYPVFLSYIMTKHATNQNDWDFDFIWLNIFENHEALGSANNARFHSGSEIERKFNKLIECNSYFTATSIHIKPSLALGSDGIFSINSCTMKDGVTYDDLITADSKWVSHREAVGMEDAMYRWIPDAGWSRDTKADFLNVYVATDLMMRGRSIDLLWSGSAAVWQSIYGDIHSCDQGRIWRANYVGRKSS